MKKPQVKKLSNDRGRRCVSVESVTESLRFRRPQTKDALRDYVKVFLRVQVPDSVFTNGHTSPMDYIWSCFNLDFETEHRPNGDCVVWASRGGGKTQSAAILSILDATFKPGVQIRILSGSGYQAGRMYDYFHRFATQVYPETIQIDKTWPVRKVVFKNGASVEVLVQTEISVRGQHVHKLRCDEVELFKPKVYAAAQYTTMSDGLYVAGTEVISTMHRTRGLMKTLVEEAKVAGNPLFKWNLWDVCQACEKVCVGCPLVDSCKGKAKNGKGYYRIDDALSQLQRAKQRSFFMEMLCSEGEKKNGAGNLSSGCIDYLEKFWKTVNQLGGF